MVRVGPAKICPLTLPLPAWGEGNTYPRTVIIFGLRLDPIRKIRNDSVETQRLHLLDIVSGVDGIGEHLQPDVMAGLDQARRDGAVMEADMRCAEGHSVCKRISRQLLAQEHHHRGRPVPSGGLASIPAAEKTHSQGPSKPDSFDD